MSILDFQRVWQGSVSHHYAFSLAKILPTCDALYDRKQTRILQTSLDRISWLKLVHSPCIPRYFTSDFNLITHSLKNSSPHLFKPILSSQSLDYLNNMLLISPVKSSHPRHPLYQWGEKMTSFMPPLSIKMKKCKPPICQA